MTFAAGRAAGPGGAVAALEMSPAGPAGENERRMDP